MTPAAYAIVDLGGVKFNIQKIKEYALDQNKEEDVKYNRPPSCSKCNRIRLLSNGVIKPCLHSDQEIILDQYNINLGKYITNDSGFVRSKSIVV